MTSTAGYGFLTVMQKMPGATARSECNPLLQLVLRREGKLSLNLDLSRGTNSFEDQCLFHRHVYRVYRLE